MNPLISAASLAALLDAPGPGPVLLDVRWSLGRSDGRELYAAGHIPGAVFVDLERELSSAPGHQTGRHPLPLPADFEAAARRWGVNQDSQVVVYDDAGALAAARAWWLLRHAGFENVSVLDGGLEAYKALPGAKLAAGEQSNTPGDITLSWGRMPVIEFDQLAGFAGTLIDSRATARYLGIEEPIDPVAGHIPGAVSAPLSEFTDADGRLLDKEALHAYFAGLGVFERPEVAAYCGSGITAARLALALRQIGVTAGVYAGSWSEWITDPERPVATGP